MEKYAEFENQGLKTRLVHKIALRNRMPLGLQVLKSKNGGTLSLASNLIYIAPPGQFLMCVKLFPGICFLKSKCVWAISKCMGYHGNTKCDFQEWWYIYKINHISAAT